MNVKRWTKAKLIDALERAEKDRALALTAMDHRLDGVSLTHEDRNRILTVLDATIGLANDGLLNGALADLIDSALRVTADIEADGGRICRRDSCAFCVMRRSLLRLLPGGKATIRSLASRIKLEA
jgi:hypothetical protein